MLSDIQEGKDDVSFVLVFKQSRFGRNVVEVVLVIYNRYIHTNDGINDVVKYLNNHGYKKKIRQNGIITGFSSNFVKDVLDSPVFIWERSLTADAKQKKKLGSRNEMHVIEQDEFPIYEGQHEAIISEENWNLI